MCDNIYWEFKIESLKHMRVSGVMNIIFENCACCVHMAAVLIAAFVAFLLSLACLNVPTVWMYSFQ